MNIKKSLFISNILMIIIPVTLSAIVGLLFFLVFTGVININKDKIDYDSDLFWKVTETADKTVSGWSKDSNLQAIEADIDRFNAKYNRENISLTLYEKDQLIYPSGSLSDNQSEQLVQILQGGSITHTGFLDHTAFYSRRVDNYTAVLICTQYMDISSHYLKYKNTLIGFGGLLFVLAIFIIGITNYLLTKSLLHRIVGPLEILNYGVHQIQLGNLDYRIEYGRKDEFSIVCADFNLMAQKLRESVDRQKKDEISRKELIAGISHDLRTPLTSIKAYVEGLIDEIAATPQAQKSYLQTIKAKAEDINQIVDKLFLFSKLDIGEFPFYPEKLMIGEELVQFVKATSDEYRDKGLILKLTQTLKNVTIHIDPVQFRNVITNILENSVKYRIKDCGLMEIACFEQGQSICITLTDDGPGVPEEALDKIFDIFYRNDPSRNNPGKGSGLGLAISAKIIERSEGNIRAENVPAGGLRIVITIPIWGLDGDIL